MSLLNPTLAGIFSLTSLRQTMVDTTCSCKHLGDDHCFIRCGCKNDMPMDHPMHINDDAFHRVWCIQCLKYCYKKPACAARLPKTRVKRSMRRQLHKFPEYVFFCKRKIFCICSAAAYCFIYRSVGVFASVKMFFRKRMERFSHSELV